MLEGRCFPLGGIPGLQTSVVVVVIREKTGNGAEGRSRAAAQAKVPGGLGLHFRWHILKIKQHPSRILGPSAWSYGQSLSIFGSCRMKTFSASMVLLFPSHIPSLYGMQHQLNSFSSSETLLPGSLFNILSILPLALAFGTVLLHLGANILCSLAVSAALLTRTETPWKAG